MGVHSEHSVFPLVQDVDDISRSYEGDFSAAGIERRSRGTLRGKPETEHDIYITKQMQENWGRARKKTKIVIKKNESL